MLEAKWKLNSATGRGWHFSDALDSDPLFSLEAQTSELERVLDKLIRDGNGVSNVEIFDATLRAGFLPKHANEVLKSWQNFGKITAEPSDPRPVRKGAFYLNYENFKNRDRRIIIRSL